MLSWHFLVLSWWFKNVGIAPVFCSACSFFFSPIACYESICFILFFIKNNADVYQVLFWGESEYF